MEVQSQLHALTTLFLRKKPPLPTEQDFPLAPGLVLLFWKRETIVLPTMSMHSRPV